MSAVYEYKRMPPKRIAEVTREAWGLNPLPTFLIVTPPDGHSRAQVLRELRNAPEHAVINWK